MRVTADGRLDQTFGELGMWRARGHELRHGALRRRADRTAPCSSGMEGNSWGTIVRLTESGSPDTTFSGDGFAPLTESATPEQAGPAGRRAGAVRGRFARRPADGGRRARTRRSAATASCACSAVPTLREPRHSRSAARERWWSGDEPGLGFRAAAVDPAGVRLRRPAGRRPVLEGARSSRASCWRRATGRRSRASVATKGWRWRTSAADGTPDWSVYEPDAGRAADGRRRGRAGTIAVVTLTGNADCATPRTANVMPPSERAA